MTAEIPDAIANKIIDEIIEQARMIEVSKDWKPVELASAVIFDGAKLVGVRGLPTAKEWRENYFSAVGPLLFVPRDWRTSMGGKARLRIVIHEATHTSQFWADARFVPWYVGHTEARAAYEGEAYGTGDEFDFATDGQIAASVDALVHPVREGYAMNDGDKRLVGGMREQHVTSVVNGVITSHWGRYAIQRLWQLAPACLDPRAVATIQAGSPGLLV